MPKLRHGVLKFLNQMATESGAHKCKRSVGNLFDGNLLLRSRV